MAQFPSIIIGGDPFLNYWGPQRRPELGTIEGVTEVLSAAYTAGARGLDLSMNEHVRAAAKRMAAQGQSLRCFANPNWLLPIRFEGMPLWQIRGRMMATVLAARPDIWELQETNPAAFDDWFGLGRAATPLTRAEIHALEFDAEEFRRRLQWFTGTAEYCLIGGDYADWLLPLERRDLIETMVGMARAHGFTPVSITHLPTITLAELDTMDVAGHWIPLSQDRHLISEPGLRHTLTGCAREIAAFRVLGMGRHAQRVRPAFEHVIRDWHIRSVVVGVDHAAQAADTVSLLQQLLPAADEVQRND